QEIEHYKQGKHGQSKKQAIAIGIAKARRHGIPYPRRGKSSDRGEKTKRELYKEAQRKGIKGRSKMNKRELQRALRKAA
ncbi:MAG TPA: DNA-binding protein, partial [Terriglobales bacterium]|nr:DNA-binding protein [Terriglobales bacterium]